MCRAFESHQACHNQFLVNPFIMRIYEEFYLLEFNYLKLSKPFKKCQKGVNVGVKRGVKLGG